MICGFPAQRWTQLPLRPAISPMPQLIANMQAISLGNQVGQIYPINQSNAAYRFVSGGIGINQFPSGFPHQLLRTPSELNGPNNTCEPENTRKITKLRWRRPAIARISKTLFLPYNSRRRCHRFQNNLLLLSTRQKRNRKFLNGLPAKTTNNGRISAMKILWKFLMGDEDFEILRLNADILNINKKDMAFIIKSLTNSKVNIKVATIVDEENEDKEGENDSNEQNYSNTEGK
ncbi:hypothetical protein ACOME3_000267 [Neoechinorhynchus agilis]